MALMTAARGEEGLGQLSKVAINVIGQSAVTGALRWKAQYSTGWTIVWLEGKLVKHN